MPFDNRPNPLAATRLIVKPGDESFDWTDLEALFGAFDPSPAPWQAWEGLGIGKSPELPLDMAADGTASSIYGYRKRWENQDSKLTLTDCFRRVMFYLNPVVHYNVLGGSLPLPGGAAHEFAVRNPSFAAASNFEAIRRSIIADEYGVDAFENGDIKRGRVADPRLRDWASRETNVRITNEAAETLMMGCDYTMLWAAQALYPQQTKALRDLAAQEGRKLICRLVAGTQDIAKTLQEAHDHGTKTGEWMHPRQIIGTVQAFSRNFKQAVEAADSVEVYNTDGPIPILIARKTGPGAELEILNQTLFFKFYEQQFYNPAGTTLEKIDPRRALYKLFGQAPGLGA